MSIQVKFRRGSAGQHGSFTGANGEITVDTTNKTLRVHDGVTAGGIRLAKYNEIGAASANLQSVTTNVVPQSNVTLDLGTSTKRWRSLYLSGNTIYLGGLNITTTANGSVSFRNSSNQPAPIQTSSVIISGNTQSDIAKLTVTNLILRNVLGTQYGGTGSATITKDGVAFGATTSRLGFITGTYGQVMQVSANGTPSFGSLDGGSYS
jgi:hypothetical protein